MSSSEEFRNDLTQRLGVIHDLIVVRALRDAADLIDNPSLASLPPAEELRAQADAIEAQSKEV